MVDPVPAPEIPAETATAATRPDASFFPRLQRTGKGVSWALFAAVIAGLAIALVAVWLEGRRAIGALRVEAAQRLATVEATSALAGKEQARMAIDLRDAQAKVALLEARLAESQTQQASLEALYRDLAPSRDDIALTEIEQVLLIASQQLQLAGNVASALSALQLADAKLQRLDRPQFVAFRRALTRDIDALKATPYVDVAGLSLKLDQAIASVDTLTLARDERIPEPPVEKGPAADEPAWRRFLRDAWSDVRQLVRIEVSDRPAAPLVLPAQSYFLRENLKLRLLSARLALVNRQDASFKADLAAADDWIRHYFDLRTKPVQGLLATLKQAGVASAAGALPDLSRSLEALRVLKLAQDRAMSRAPAK